VPLALTKNNSAKHHGKIVSSSVGFSRGGDKVKQGFNNKTSIATEIQGATQQGILKSDHSIGQTNPIKHGSIFEQNQNIINMQFKRHRPLSERR
jgi:hypothetical protein